MNGDVVVVAGAGIGLGRTTSDQVHLTFLTVSGNADIVARLRQMPDSHPLATAGIMIRGSLDADGPYAALSSSALSGMSFSRRLARGWTAIQTAARSVSWFKLERRGELVSAFASADGSGWDFVGSDQISFEQTIHVGLMVSSHQTGTLATAVFDRVEVRAGGAAESPVVWPAPATVPDPDPIAAPQSVPEPVPDPVPQPAPVTVEQSPPAPDPLPTVGSEPPQTGSTAAPDTVSTTPGSASTPASPVAPLRYLVFEPSPDHDTTVVSYVFEVAHASSFPATVLQRDIGKPSVENGECRVDVSALLSLLPSGSYVGLVRASNAVGLSVPGVSAAFSK